MKTNNHSLEKVTLKQFCETGEVVKHDLVLETVGAEDRILRAFTDGIVGDPHYLMGRMYGVARAFVLIAHSRVEVGHILSCDRFHAFDYHTLVDFRGQWKPLTVDATVSPAMVQTFGAVERAALAQFFWYGAYQPAWGCNGRSYSWLSWMDSALHVARNGSCGIRDDLKVLDRSCCTGARCVIIPEMNGSWSRNDSVFIWTIMDELMKTIGSYPDRAYEWGVDTFTTLVSDVTTAFMIALYNLASQELGEDEQVRAYESRYTYTPMDWVLITDQIVAALKEEFCHD